MELGPNVTHLADGERDIYIVGTAHISKKSIEEVRDTIESIRPDTVCVELCENRYQSMIDTARWKKLDIFQIIRQKKVLFLLSNLALSSYQRRMGEKFGVEPGAELREAIKMSEEVEAELVLVDRDIQATLKRTWANLSFWNKIKVMSGLFGGVFSDEDISEEELEKLKEKDHLSDMMAEFARLMPQVKEPLIDERDHFLMSAIDDAPGTRVVAVVGAGHVPGMIAHRGEPVDRDKLSEIPSGSSWTKWLKWIIPALVLGAFAFGYQKHAGANFEDMFWAWVLPNSIMAGLLAAIGGAKVLSILTAIIASPITSLNPTIGAGMVVGFVEAWLRKPTVEDAERLNQDMMTLSGIYKNAFSRVLLVAALATIGSSLGAFVGAPLVLGLLR
jgi:pheromone shutdown-related protein TraB